MGIETVNCIPSCISVKRRTLTAVLSMLRNLTWLFPSEDRIISHRRYSHTLCRFLTSSRHLLVLPKQGSRDHLPILYQFVEHRWCGYARKSIYRDSTALSWATLGGLLKAWANRTGLQNPRFSLPHSLYFGMRSFIIGSFLYAAVAHAHQAVFHPAMYVFSGQGEIIADSVTCRWCFDVCYFNIHLQDAPFIILVFRVTAEMSTTITTTLWTRFIISTKPTGGCITSTR